VQGRVRPRLSPPVVIAYVVIELLVHLGLIVLGLAELFVEELVHEGFHVPRRFRARDRLLEFLLHEPQPADSGPPNVPGPGVGTGGRQAQPSAQARVGRRWVAAAFGQRNGAPARALAEKLAWIAEHETNPWVILRAAEFLRDTLDGKLRPAPEVKEPRRRSLIIVETHGNGHAPPAGAPEPTDTARPGEHEENGERFVAVPPSEE
jgi:hypothetical protein